jgi:adenylyltransferase/sulfurtransferase
MFDLNRPIDTRRFAILGCGGLGCPVVMGLFAAGVRRFQLIDFDRIEAHNLHRQVAYGIADRGRFKAETLRDWIVSRDCNAEVSIDLGEAEIDFMADDFFLADDVIVECSDRPDLKFAVSDYCASQQRPAIVGGAQGWHGHVFAYLPGGACLRCLFEDADPAAASLSCEAAGVFSTTTGVVGMHMASAALEILTNRASASFFVNCEMRTSTVRRLNLRRRETCSCVMQPVAPPPGTTFEPRIMRA